MRRIFGATCPACMREFYVSWTLRFGPQRLHCPYCGHRFGAGEAKRLDERFSP